MAGTVAPNIITDNLILYLDAANNKSYVSGSTSWNDLSPSQKNGILTNGPAFNTGSGGNIVFDGVDDFILLPTNFINYPSLTTFTISTWFKSTQSTGGTIFGQQDSNNPNSSGGWIPVIYLRSDGIIRVEPFWTGNSTNFLTSSVLLNDNVWHNITTTYNNGTNQLYIDGNFTSQRTGLNFISYTSTYYYIIGAGYSAGRSLGTNYYNGNVSNFSFYNKTLLASEILQNYNTTKPRFGL